VVEKVVVVDARFGRPRQLSGDANPQLTLLGRRWSRGLRFRLHALIYKWVLDEQRESRIEKFMSCRDEVYVYRLFES
jgi:hypothetical protein